jgi:hypothetical protein
MKCDLIVSFPRANDTLIQGSNLRRHSHDLKKAKSCCSFPTLSHNIVRSIARAIFISLRAGSTIT